MATHTGEQVEESELEHVNFDPHASLEVRAGQALTFASGQIDRLVTQHPDYFPLFTHNGTWRHEKESWSRWCEGFLAGQMWILATRTGDSIWRERAEHYCRLMEDRQYDPENHDLGFLFWSSWRRWNEVDPSPERKAVLIQAGRTMANRFNPRGKYLRSFVSPGSCFVDIMMNVGIIFYAAQQTGDDELRRRAFEHSLTTRRYLLRGDGSTVHDGIFDPESGEYLHASTHQGWRNDTSWARGLTWALYGFGTAYHFTGDPRFLDSAERCADFYIDRTPSHGVPPNDWEQPNPVRPVESSAAASAASGLFQLAALTKNPAKAVSYRAYARRILDTLLSPDYLAVDTPGWEGILRHASYHERLGLGVDESVMWGEYYFLEALDKLLGAPAVA